MINVITLSIITDIDQSQPELAQGKDKSYIENKKTTVSTKRYFRC